MDYVEIVENYVKEAWSQGKSTAQIKAELIAKRWPEAMVEAVVDRLVKQRVETTEGKLPAINGPDLWTHPTWPVTPGGWTSPVNQASANVDKIYTKNRNNVDNSQKNKRRKLSEMIAQNSSDSPVQASPQPPTEAAVTTPIKTGQNSEKRVDDLYTNSQKNIDDSQKKESNISPKNPPATAVAAANDIINHQPASQITAPTTTPEPAVLVSAPAASQATTPPTSTSHARHAQIVAHLHAKETGVKKLPQKLQESRLARQNDEKIQFRSLIFLAGLFFVIILALLWRFFVIQ